MARRGRRPKDKVVDDLSRVVVESIDRFIDSHRRSSARSIYNRFGLVDRGINERTFRLYVHRRRKAHPIGQADDDQMPLDPYERGMQLAIERIDAGDPKHLPGISSFLRVCLEQRRVGFEEAAEHRASEKHDAWKKDYLSKMAKEKATADAKLDRIASEKGITDEVRDGIKDLYGLSI